MANTMPTVAPRAVAIPETAPGERQRPSALQIFRANPVAVAGLAVLSVIVLLGLTVPFLSPYDPTRADPRARLAPPSETHWAGTDGLGRDVMTRALYGARVSLPIGVTVMVLGTCIGTLIGVLAGYYPRFDSISMRILDGFMAFPGILLAIALVAALRANVYTLILAITVVSVPVMARLVRGVTLSAKHMAYVEAARAIGAPDERVLLRHVLPAALPVLVVHSTFGISDAILAEAALSFLGMGIPPETPTWGTMLQEGQSVIARAWWLAVAPGLTLFVTVLALNLVGDGLRDALDPRLRGR